LPSFYGINIASPWGGLKEEEKVMARIWWWQRNGMGLAEKRQR